MEDHQVTARELREDQEAALDHAVAVGEVGVRIVALRRRISELEAQAEDLRHGLEEAQSVRPSVLPKLCPGDLVARYEVIMDELESVREDQYALIAAALCWRHSATEVRAWCMRAVAMGACHPRFDMHLIDDLMHVRRVPNAPLRAALLALQDGVDQSAVREDCGVKNRYHSEDYRREACDALGISNPRDLEKQLGMRTRNGTTVSLWISYESASLLAPILNIQPRNAGI